MIHEVIPIGDPATPENLARDQDERYDGVVAASHPGGPEERLDSTGKGHKVKGIGMEGWSENEVNVKGWRMRFDVDAGLSMRVETYLKPCP